MARVALVSATSLVNTATTQTPRAVRGDHDLVGLILGHAEFRLQHRDDEFARREIVVDEDDLVQARPFGLGLDLGLWLDDGIDHSGGVSLKQNGSRRARRDQLARQSAKRCVMA